MEGFSNVVGDAEGVENAVTFCRSEDHFSKLQYIFGGKNPRNVDKSKLFKSGSREVDSLLCFSFSLLGAENLPCLEEKIFVIFEVHNFFLCIIHTLDRVIDSTISFLDLSLNFIHQNLVSNLPLFNCCM